MTSKLINKITDKSILLFAIMALPLNAIVYVALMNCEHLFARFIPPLFGVIAILLAFLRYRINITLKAWSFIALLFFAACFYLLIALFDLAIIWFIITIIYSLFIIGKKEAFYIFISSIIVISIVEVLIFTKVTYIPLNYEFENHKYASIGVRILHFLFVGFLAYANFDIFRATINTHVKELQIKAFDLEVLNIALKKEMTEKKEIQQQMLETIILTEEKERKRLASDLHDGLGPVLSAINLYYQAYIDAPDADSKYEIENKLKIIIDDAIADVSRISHNISPHILEHYGLITALKAFTDQINISGKIKIDIAHGKINRFDLKNELTVYRTIAELINNTIKHAAASLISIHIFPAENFLKVIYKDNGNGFSVEEKSHDKSGMGLINIQNRIRSLNGNIKFESSKTNGITVQFEIPYIEIQNYEAN